MRHLPISATDEDLLKFIDGWAALLEMEDYEGAFTYVGHVPEMNWTPQLIKEVVKAYGEMDCRQKVTVQGVPTDTSQRKKVTRWETRRPAGIGYIWYDLNIDGHASDLTALFDLDTDGDGLVVKLDDIHVL